MAAECLPAPAVPWGRRRGGGPPFRAERRFVASWPLTGPVRGVEEAVAPGPEFEVRKARAADSVAWRLGLEGRPVGLFAGEAASGELTPRTPAARPGRASWAAASAVPESAGIVPPPR